MRKIALLSLFFLLVSIAQISVIKSALGFNPSDSMVTRAATQLGKPYELGQPLNKELIFGGGGIFDFDTWTGGLDCSGLVL